MLLTENWEDIDFDNDYTPEQFRQACIEYFCGRDSIENSFFGYDNQYKVLFDSPENKTGKIFWLDDDANIYDTEKFCSRQNLCYTLEG